METVKRGKIPPALAASSAFRKYTPETEHAIRVPVVKTNRTLEKMKRIWRRSIHDGGLNVVAMGVGIEKLRYSAKDVEAFSMMLAEFQGQKGFSDNAGFFLSELINGCKEDEVVIHTAHLTEKIDNLGYCNTRHITVKGNAGWKAGFNMEGGTIIIEGDAGGEVGLLMEAGSIIVKGNAGVWVGQKMKGGIIIVEGNSGEHVGYQMRGGEIHIVGDDYEIAGDIWCGKIFHGDELLIDKAWDPNDTHEDAFDDYNR
jgi:hypothetical protein